MSQRQPTASVTGQAGWEWNELQAKREGETTRNPGIATNQQRQKRRADTEQLRRRISALELELERKERRRRNLITRYERLLAEQKRQRTARSESESGESSFLARLVARVPQPWR